MKPFIFEDELPEDISDREYSEWFALSWVDGVRVGPRMHFSSKHCWCCPDIEYIDPETGNTVYVHNDINLQREP